MDDRVKIAIAVVVTCLLAFGAALVFSQNAIMVMYDDGSIVDVPNDMQVVFTPNTGDLSCVVKCVAPITLPVVTPDIEPPEEDCLVISPASTCAEMRELMGNLGR